MTDPILAPIAITAASTIPQRRFFVTEGGYIGNGPPRVRPGDEIYVLPGGKMPFVLRRGTMGEIGSSLDSDFQSHHKLVGDCYVHGIMDGEAMTDFEKRSCIVYLE